MFCAYKTLAGEPNKGIHAYRIGGVAAVDVIMTVIGAFIIYRVNKSLDIMPLPYAEFWIILCLLFALGIIAHRVFCVRTTVDKLLFP